MYWKEFLKPNKKIIAIFTFVLIFMSFVLIAFLSGLYTGRYLDVMVSKEDITTTTITTTSTTSTTINIENFTKGDLTQKFCPPAMISIYGDDIFYHFINKGREMKFIDNGMDYYCKVLSEPVQGLKNISFQVYREAKDHIFFRYYSIPLEDLI